MSYIQSFLTFLNSILQSLLLSFTIVSTSPSKPKPELRHPAKLSFDEWQNEQAELDAIRGIDHWVDKDKDRNYNWRALKALKLDLQIARRNHDYVGVCSQVRAQSSRNICNLLSPVLYRRSRVQTKRLIQDYILEVSKCVWFIARHDNLLLNPSLDKAQVLHDVRQSLGRSTLVLQGGAMVSTCHLGVVKALHEQNLLPQIITGTATGSLIAALVAVTSDDGLPNVLSGSGINIDAFLRVKAPNPPQGNSWLRPSWVDTIQRRWARFKTTGHFFNIDVLKECARENFGDITFEEAYAKTGRILNITVAMSDVAGTPQLLNYITAPHVLIWSAVMASIATSKKMYAPVSLFCKTNAGAVIEYYAADSTESTISRPTAVHYEAPLQRIGELFNVNHFIVSQTRPYIIPFIRLQRWADDYLLPRIIVRSLLSEGLHWLEVAARLKLLPSVLERILVDEIVPSYASWSKMNITPKLSWYDLSLIIENPTSTSLAQWAALGERSTWPAICELKIRCAVELELEAAYGRVRRKVI